MITLRIDEQELRKEIRKALLELGATPSTSPEETRFWTVKEAARFLSLSHKTLYNLIPHGLPHIKKGKRLYFKKDDLIKWLADGN